MCSVGEDEFEDTSSKIMVKEQIALPDKCNKCRVEKSRIVLRHKDTYCKNCFLAATIHKFKALLGKSRLVRPIDKVLICHKIGHPSTALLHFLRTGLDLNTPKKIRFNIEVLFIEDQFQLTVDERQEIIRKVKEEVTSFGFKIHFTSFIKYLSHSEHNYEIVESDGVYISEDDKNVLRTVLGRVSKSNKNDLLNLFKRQLLVDVAKYLDCKFIFLPETSAEIASHLLSNISLGRGSNIPFDTGFCDDRDEVKVLRPLRLFDMKELAFYNKFNNLEPISIRQHEINYYSSVQNLMTKFVNDLQENYPATVTTVMRTGDKLALDRSSNKRCKSCKGVVIEKGSELTSDESTRFSRLVSTTIPNYAVSRQERYQNILDKFNEELVINNDYCYSCSKLSP